MATLKGNRSEIMQHPVGLPLRANARSPATLSALRACRRLSRDAEGRRARAGLWRQPAGSRRMCAAVHVAAAGCWLLAAGCWLLALLLLLLAGMCQQSALVEYQRSLTATDYAFATALPPPPPLLVVLLCAGDADLWKRSEHIKKWNKRWFVLWPEENRPGDGRVLFWFDKPVRVAHFGRIAR